LDELYSIYTKAYKIPTIKYDINLEDEDSFVYCTSRKHFVVVFPFGPNKDVLMTESFEENKIHWLPIAGSVDLNRRENFLTASLRLAKQVYPNVLLGELEPIAILENNFTFKTSSWIHIGIAFIARIRNKNLGKDMYTNKTIRGRMLCLEKLLNKDYCDVAATQRDKLISLVKEYVLSKNIYLIQEEEINGYFSKKLRFQIHNKTTKPLLNLIGRFAFTYSIGDVNQKMQDIILNDNPQRIIDIACGDNDFVINLTKIRSFELVVANDLSWFQLQSIQNALDDTTFTNSNSTILFTNHDAKSMPFNDKFFDVLICKNVLHHMKNVGDLKAIINEMDRISNKIVIVEVLDPRYEGCWGRLRHKYIYDKLLKEVEAGDNFLSRDAFKEVCSMGNCTDQFEMPTVRGVYQFCIFENKG